MKHWHMCEVCGAAFNTSHAEGQWCAGTPVLPHRPQLVGRIVKEADVIDRDGHNWMGRVVLAKD